MFRSTLADAFGRFSQAHSTESTWSAFKSAIGDACVTLPSVSSNHDLDWVTDELCNLSKNKGSVWLCYRDAASMWYDVDRCREEYKWYVDQSCCREGSKCLVNSSSCGGRQTCMGCRTVSQNQHLLPLTALDRSALTSKTPSQA